jgi:hypothetical protein
LRKKAETCLPQALRHSERAYSGDAYLKKVMLSEGLRASVKFAVVLHFVIPIPTPHELHRLRRETASLEKKDR